ncbi:LysR family transcriptional regulator [Afifella sp. IM 167]|uniref:LysR family transcriptional regulator n=1 Tax=Afifella sp. IM 167 TaxID=2033586 RepID=UPI001CCC6818|nr:LysR family transcriptional regulator [Afifella sp. IM 167]
MRIEAAGGYDRQMELLDQHNREIRSADFAIDLEVLRSFCTISEIGNMTRAAQRLGRAQSTLSSHIRRIEDVYDCALFQRTSDGMRLTDKGYVVLSCAQRILHTHTKALADLKGPRLSGPLRVGIMDDFAIERFPAILKRFGAVHPDVRLEIEVGLSARLHSRLQDGEIDLAVARRHPGESGGRFLAREALCWVGPPAGIDIDESAPLPLVLFTPDCLYREIVLKALDAAGRSWRIVAVSSTLAGVVAPTFAGFGVTVLAQGTIPRELRRIDDGAGLPSLPETEIAMFSRKGSSSEAAEALMDTITSQF